MKKQNAPLPFLPPPQGLQVRTLLTVRQISPDNCKTVDSGFQIQTAAFTLSNLPTEEQCNVCRPPFCASFGGEGTKKEAFTACQQPFVRSYFDLPGVGTHFQPFGTAQLDWEPRGHAPVGVYDDPHFDFHAYYVDRAAVEAIAVGPCSRTGFLSPDAWRRALRPVPAACFPTGPWASTALAVAGMGSHLVNLLAPELRTAGRGFGQTFIFGAHDGAVTFVEAMASARWLAANAANASSLHAAAPLCYPIVGGPTRYLHGGYKPGRYCFEPPPARAAPGKAPGVATVRFADMRYYPSDVAACDPDAPGVRYHPDSYAPALQEAYALNRDCVYDVRPVGAQAGDAGGRDGGGRYTMATAPVGAAETREAAEKGARREAMAGMVVAAVG